LRVYVRLDLFHCFRSFRGGPGIFRYELGGIRGHDERENEFWALGFGRCALFLVEHVCMSWSMDLVSFVSRSGQHGSKQSSTNVPTSQETWI
jgi:hypothetical protein